jgi:hypothetical protein
MAFVKKQAIPEFLKRVAKPPNRVNREGLKRVGDARALGRCDWCG